MVHPVLAAAPPWPVLALGVLAVTGLCLWLLFRSGSIGDRARDDHDEHDDHGHRGPGGDEAGPDRDPDPLR